VKISYLNYYILSRGGTWNSARKAALFGCSTIYSVFVFLLCSFLLMDKMRNILMIPFHLFTCRNIYMEACYNIWHSTISSR